MTRSIILALPTEIDNRSKIQLVRKFVQENFTEIGMIADLSIHQIDCDNPYAYILLTMRVSIVTPTGEIQFTRKNRTWNNRFFSRSQQDRSLN